MSEDNVKRGLEGVRVAETTLSHIDGDAGELTIGGYPLEELAPNATFEEVVFLLRNDRLPSENELTEFQKTLAEHRSIPEPTMDVVRAAAEADRSAMDALRMGAATLTLDTDSNPERDTLRTVAAFPTIVAAYWRIRNGETPVDPRSDLSHAANYLYMLNGEPASDAEVRGLETYLNAVVDHGLNASTFAARAVISTETDVVSAATAAVGSLKGPLHGGAPGPVLDMLLDIADTGDPEAYVTDALEAGDRLMGFGHRVYRVRDPRAAVLSTAAEQFYGSDGDREFFELANDVEAAAVNALAEHKPDRDLQTNVEFYTAVLLHGVGIPGDLFSATFAVSRVAGWTAHCLEQLADNRIIRPRAAYVGDTDRSWTAVDQR